MVINGYRDVFCCLMCELCGMVGLSLKCMWPYYILLYSQSTAPPCHLDRPTIMIHIKTITMISKDARKYIRAAMVLYF